MTQTPIDDLMQPEADPGGPGHDGTTPYAAGTDDARDEFDDLDEDPVRRRVPLVTRLLGVALMLALAFTAGVLVQKQLGASTATTGLPAGFPSGGFPGGGLPGAGSGTGAAAGSTGSSGSTAGTGSSAVPVVVGKVVSVNGSTVVVEDLGGTRHTVRTTDGTTVTATTSVPLSDLAAGTTVRVDGTKTGDGSVDATSVTVR